MKASQENWKVFVQREVVKNLKKLKLRKLFQFYSMMKKLESIFNQIYMFLVLFLPKPVRTQSLQIMNICSKITVIELNGLGYLSTTSVYGDKKGNWVTEDSLLEPNIERSIFRIQAEDSG